MEGWLTAAIIGLVVALVNVIGGGLVIRWLARQIRALKGTVDAQTETLKTIGEVNRTVLEVFKAMEPRRWAEEVQVHKKLADEKAAALVDEARRQFEKDKETLQETLKGYQEAVGVGLSLLPYVPKEERQKAVDDTAAPDSIKKVFLEVAATAPDWNRRLRTLDRLDALGTLAAGLAHEIKNPLTSLLTFSRHLERKFDDPHFRERFTSVVPRELERINGIVERLLELAQPARVSFTLVRLPELLERALELYGDQLDDRRIDVVREYARDVPQIQADKDALYRVFVNLVANAIDAMTRGGRLTVRAGWAGTGDPVPTARRLPVNRVKIEIEDTGVGIEPSDADRIFNPFYTTRDSGTGLGLALAHQIVEDHGGAISFKSAPGRGTTFTIILSLVPELPNRAGSEPSR